MFQLQDKENFFFYFLHSHSNRQLGTKNRSLIAAGNIKSPVYTADNMACIAPSMSPLGGWHSQTEHSPILRQHFPSVILVWMLQGKAHMKTQKERIKKLYQHLKNLHYPILCIYIYISI